MSLIIGSGGITLAQTPPSAEKRSHHTELHGDVREDPYFWLRDKGDAAVKAYLKQENAYTEAVLSPEKDLRKKLVAEMKARMVDEDVSVPYRFGDWLYYSKDVAGKDHELICRKGLNDGKGVVLLDLNERAGKSDAYDFGGGAISADGWVYAWKENHDGTDRYTLRCKDLRTGKLLPDKVPDIIFDDAPVWSLDGKSIFYTEGDETERSWRVKRHILGQPSTADTVVYEEPDARFQVFIDATKDRRYLLITSAGKDTDENSLLPLDQPDQKPQVVTPRQEGIRYDLANWENYWYIISNEGAVNGRLFRAPIQTPQREHWEEVLPGDESIAYDAVDAFATHVILGARKDGVPGIFILDPKTADVRWVTAPVEGASLEEGNTPQYDAKEMRVSYESFLTPNTVADVNLATGEFTVLKTEKIPAGFDPTRYRVERTFAAAADGEKISIWLLLPAQQPKDGTGAIYLTGYGAYGSASDPWFDSDVLSLLDRGVGYGIAQVRGGGEYGRRWYEAGKFARKQNTFSDFIACAEHLVKERYTSPEHLCGYGASAGGLLAGAVVNQRPDLFRAFVAEVPFVDALNTMLDPTIPLTTTEYDEWGNPSASEEAYRTIRAYAPYENVKAQAYPALLVLAGWNDTRVPYWEAAKWVAKLRDLKTDQQPLLLKTNLDTGHSGVSGRYSQLQETALQYAFVLKMLGREALLTP